MVTFADLVAGGSLQINDGYRTRRDELGEPGFPVLRVAEIGDGHVAPSYGDHVRIEYRDNIGYKLSRPGDVLLTTKGTVGRRAIMPDLGTEFVYSPQLCFFRALDDSVNSRWLYYWLASDNFWSQAIGVSQQTDMAPYISLRDLRAIQIEIPHPEEQKAVADTLGSLDNKIESNRRMISLIPELIRAKVRAGLSGMGEPVPVSSLARFVNGGAYTKNASGTGRMVIRIAELNSGPGGSTIYNDIDVPDDKIARPGDILMSWSGSLGVYRWSRDEAIINQHIFKVLPTTYPDWLVFDRVDEAIETFQGIAKDKATTMGHFQRGHLDSVHVVIPRGEAIEELEAELGPLWDSLLVAEREVLTLAALRDTLLPELLSSRIRVRSVLG